MNFKKNVLLSILMLVALILVLAGPVLSWSSSVKALPNVCNSQCTVNSSCSTSCTDPETHQVITCGQWGVCAPPNGIPPYSPAYWNDGARIQRCNNCYNYGNNKRTDNYAQPGYASGNQGPYPPTCSGTYAAAVRDGLVAPSGGVCPYGLDKLALVIWPGTDYHWYRLDSNGMWSHKPGKTPATNLDNSGNSISNPETANRGNYTTFCGYLCSPSDVGQGQGNANIAGRYNCPYASAAQNAKGLKVTILMFSGRPDPTYLVEDEQTLNAIRDSVGQAQAKGVTQTSDAPPLLGYKGILVENPGSLPGLPSRMVVYKQNVWDGEQNQQFADDGSLENMLLKQALVAGVLDQKGLAFIESSQGQ